MTYNTDDNLKNLLFQRVPTDSPIYTIYTAYTDLFTRYNMPVLAAYPVKSPGLKWQRKRRKNMSRNYVDTTSPINAKGSGSKTVDNVGMWSGRTSTHPPTWVFSVPQLSVNPTATYNSLLIGKYKQIPEEGHDEKWSSFLRLELESEIDDQPSMLQQLPLEKLFSVLQDIRGKGVS